MAGEWHLATGPAGAPGTRTVVGVFVPLDILDGMVRLERRYQEAFQLSTGRETLETLPQNTFLFLTLLTLFAAVWTGLTIARTISEPVRALAKAAQRVGRGDLEVSLPEQGEDELGLLSRSFNAMTRDLLQNRSAIVAQSRAPGAPAGLPGPAAGGPAGGGAQLAGRAAPCAPSTRWPGAGSAWTRGTPSGTDWEDLSASPAAGGCRSSCSRCGETRRPVPRSCASAGKGRAARSGRW